MRMRAGLPGRHPSYKQPLRVKKIGIISEIFGDDLFGHNTRKFQYKTEASVRICSGRRVDCFFFEDIFLVVPILFSFVPTLKFSFASCPASKPPPRERKNARASGSSHSRVLWRAALAWPPATPPNGELARRLAASVTHCQAGKLLFNRLALMSVNVANVLKIPSRFLLPWHHSLIAKTFWANVTHL